jgi:2-polyprenyl-3-methyl-5-hydroxy-6-metoxy-1,4-benzoquinol methylase
VDLGHAPPSNAYLTAEELEQPEFTYPLKAFVCDRCWLVQLPAHAAADQVFTSNYAYFSSVSTTWVEHSRRYVQMIGDRLRLDRDSFVVEIASNDGYLLEFVQSRGIPCLGIEPTASTAQAARRRGVETIEEFFGHQLACRLARERRPADLIVANNVLPHVPDINDFAAGVRELLAPAGVATFEFPHLMRLVEQTQFDTIYHEHYSYLSLYTVQQVFLSQGLQIVDVEELLTHGGSLRVYAQRIEAPRQQPAASVERMLADEQGRGMQRLDYYAGFQSRAERIKNDLLAFLLEQKRAGRVVAAYGAAAKGNTLLNFAGVRPDLLPYVCDAAPSKQGKFLPGSHIPILAPDSIQHNRPAYVAILPWNLREEIAGSIRYIKNWNGLFVTVVPTLEVF